MNNIIARQLVELELKNLQRSVELASQVIEVVKKFDNKKYTRRLDSALKKIDSSLVVRYVHNTFDICLYSNDFITDNNRAYYLKTNYINIMSGCKESCYGDGIEQGGVINAATAIKNIEDIAHDRKSRIETVKKQLDQVEDLKQEQKELKQKIKDFENKTDSLIKEYFELKM